MGSYRMSPRHRWKGYNESLKMSIKSGTGMQRSVPSQVPKCNAPGAHIFSGCDYFARHPGRLPHRKERDERTPDPVEGPGLPLIHDETVDEWGTQGGGPVHDRATCPIGGERADCRGSWSPTLSSINCEIHEAPSALCQVETGATASPSFCSVRLVPPARAEAPSAVRP